MNEIVTKITNATYDVFGVMLPGVMASVLFSAVLGFTLAANRVVESSRFESLWELVVEHPSGATAILAVLAYFVGLTLIWLSRGKVWVGPTQRLVGFVKGWPLWARFMLFAKASSPPESHGSELGAARRHAAAVLTKRLGSNALDLDTNWRAFYLIAKTLVPQKLQRSLIATYQSKYTFHRSLAVMFSVALWMSVIGAVFSAAASFSAPVYVLAASALLCALFVLVFASQFEYHWKLLGDAVIAETIVVLLEKEGASP
jgi:hypothetical protein